MDYSDALGGFSLLGFHPWIGVKDTPAVLAMSKKFSLRLAELIFDTTDSTVDKDMIALAHQIQNFHRDADDFASRPPRPVQEMNDANRNANPIPRNYDRTGATTPPGGR